ncbi:hypothetical protein QTP88_015328 [Uroleucon formosanum]
MELKATINGPFTPETVVGKLLGIKDKLYSNSVFYFKSYNVVLELGWEAYAIAILQPGSHNFEPKIYWQMRILSFAKRIMSLCVVDEIPSEKVTEKFKVISRIHNDADKRKLYDDAEL